MIRFVFCYSDLADDVATNKKLATRRTKMSAPPPASSASGINTAYDHLFKIVLIGDAGVGKSSILLRFTDDRFEEGHLSTIGVDLRVKFVDIEKPTKKRIKVTVWDTAGQEYVCFSPSFQHHTNPVTFLQALSHVDRFLLSQGTGVDFGVRCD